MTILTNILLVIHVLIALLLVLVVLMQRPKSEGLGAAFGGGMTENLFGAQTTNVLQKFTRTLGGIFILLTLVLSAMVSKNSRNTLNAQSALEKQLSSMPKPAEAPLDKDAPSLLPTPTPAPNTPMTPGENLPLVPMNMNPSTGAPAEQPSGLNLAPAAPGSNLLNSAPLESDTPKPADSKPADTKPDAKKPDVKKKDPKVK